ncbi:MAG: DNA primase DnaG [Candidatus Pacearchaeota archaeon]
MAKISPVSIKYIIHARFQAEGAVEKPDIIGALFGQTEGLLGDDLEMRELQKTGKIGRIEVGVNSENGRTSGEIELPSAMDKTETTIIAAALETIERIGPSDCKIIIDEIEDVRGSKRDYILERAKKLMEKLGDSGNGIDEMTSEIKTSSRTSKIQTYGTENLPCGDISGDEIIIVEGRADVVNMLKNGIKNVIAMNGVNLPETIKPLTREKPEVTLFVDGDRGGNLIIKNVTENAKIDFIAMAPEGKEVEELTSKEILQALRKKVPASEYIGDKRSRGVREYKEKESYESAPAETKVPSAERKIKKLTAKEKEKIKENISDLVGTKGAFIFNDNLEITRKLPMGRLPYLEINEEPYVIAIDGTATPRMIEVCENLGCHNLVANNFVATDTNINLVSLQ